MVLSKAAAAERYHTTDVEKPVPKNGEDCQPVYINYGAGVMTADDPVLHDPDCRYMWVDGKLFPKKWADSAVDTHSIVFNTPNGAGKWYNPGTNTTVFFTVNRQSHLGNYALDSVSGLPLNPLGPTGVGGPGKLGRFGPNHAADPVVVRWLDENTIDVVLVKRKDTGEWALPGGMVEPGEKVTATLKREFGEEAAAGGMSKDLAACFARGGVTLFKGVVDDPRNTDNAWIETEAVLYDVTDVDPEELMLKSGSDAADVAWGTVTRLPNGRLMVVVNDKTVDLYANHIDFVQAVFLTKPSL